MAAISLTPSLRADYERLFDTCITQAGRRAEVEALTAALLRNKGRYAAASQLSGVPWHFIAVVHNMECSQRMDAHLHNGDPLSRRTFHVPAGRPRTGSPPFRWEESAADALALKGLNDGTDWSLAGTLYQLERYNGFGYRRFHPEVLSPYLWSFSGHYERGKYVADGTWSDRAVSRQCGSAVLLRRLAEIGELDFGERVPAPGDDAPLVVRYTARPPADPATREAAETLQRWLNTFAGIFVRLDGHPGKRTSAAYRRVTGHYLPGDPREPRQPR